MGEGAPAQTPAPHHVQYSFNVVRYSSNSNRTTLRTAYCVLKISSFVGAVLYVHIRYTYGYTRLPCMAPMHASWMRIGGCIAIRSDDVCLTLTEYSGPVPSAATVAARVAGFPDPRSMRSFTSQELRSSGRCGKDFARGTPQCVPSGGAVGSGSGDPDSCLEQKSIPFGHCFRLSDGLREIFQTSK